MPENLPLLLILLLSLVLPVIGVFAVLRANRANDSDRQRVRDALRGWPLFLLFLATLSVVIVLNPAKMGLALWGVSKIALCAYVGYWIDRFCFQPDARPHAVEDGFERSMAWVRRSLIVAASVLAGGLIP